MNATDKISRSMTNMNKTKRTLEGFRVSGSANKPKRKVAISVCKHANLCTPIILYPCLAWSTWIRFPKIIPEPTARVTNSARLFVPGKTRASDDEPASSRFTAPGSRTWSQLQLQFQTGAGATSL